MHGGVVAFYGYLGAVYGDDVAIAVASAEGNEDFAILARMGDPRPDVPGSNFDSFGNPAIFDGRAVFFGSEFGTLASTYTATRTQPCTLYDDSGINHPFFGPLGVSTPATPAGVAYIDLTHTTTFLGLRGSPLPCGTGNFGITNVPGLRYVPQGGSVLVWPTYVNTTEYEGNAIVAYDTATDDLRCIATGLDTIPDFGGPFDFFFKADTDGERVAFIGMDPSTGFDRHEGVYLRDIAGTGQIVRVADTQMSAPGGGNFGGFEQVTIDGDLVIFEGCAGGAGGCAVYGFFGCFLDDDMPGEVFEIINTGDTVDGRPIIDVSMSPTGRDGERFAFDVRHAANSASLYVATLARPGSGACPPDFAAPFGTLDFFDIAAFISAYNAQHASADFDPNGQFNFFDVAAFIDAYNAGCP